jgi:hypothetical protein
MTSDGPQYPQYPEQDPEGASGEPPPPPAEGAPPPPPPPDAPWQTPPSGYGRPVASVGSPTNQKATWALILGILGPLCCGVFTAVPALILGIMARKEIDASGGRQSGRGMAIAGIILGIVGIIVSILFIAFWGYIVTTPEFQEGFQEGFEEGAG